MATIFAEVKLCSAVGDNPLIFELVNPAIWEVEKVENCSLVSDAICDVDNEPIWLGLKPGRSLASMATIFVDVKPRSAVGDNPLIFELVNPAIWNVERAETCPLVNPAN